MAYNRLDSGCGTRDGLLRYVDRRRCKNKSRLIYVYFAHELGVVGG